MYWNRKKIFGQARNRTHDLLLANQKFSQLRHVTAELAKSKNHMNESGNYPDFAQKSSVTASTAFQSKSGRGKKFLELNLRPACKKLEKVMENFSRLQDELQDF